MKNDKNEIMINSLASATSSIISRLLTHPLDTAKARIQAPTAAARNNPIAVAAQTYKGPIDALLKTYAKDGVFGLYRGFGVIIAGGTPGTIIYLCGYDIFKDHLQSVSGNNTQASFGIHFASGLLAETVACVVYVPVDVIKERLQVQSLASSATDYKGSMDAMLKIAKYEGIRGLYKGYIPTLVSFGPYSALYFMLYEQFKDRITVYRRARLEENPAELSFIQIIGASAAAGTIIFGQSNCHICP